MEMAITKMSSKGQIVIPQEMRKGIKKGDQLVVIRGKKQLILKKASDVSKKLIEDLEFARRTDEALKRYESGKGFKEMDGDEFLKEMEKW